MINPTEVITGTHRIYRSLGEAVAVVKKQRLGTICYVVVLFPEDEWYLQDREIARGCLDVLGQHYGKCCLLCGSSQELVVDHIVSLRRGGSSEIENLLSKT